MSYPGLTGIGVPLPRRERFHRRARPLALAHGGFLPLAVVIASLCALFGTSPAQAQFVCTTTATDQTCTNSGTVPGSEINASTTLNVTTSNSGSVGGQIITATTSGNATTTNSGSVGGQLVNSTANGNATTTNSGSVGGQVVNSTANGTATTTNSGTVNGQLVNASSNGDATATNSGSVNGQVVNATSNGNATATNSGSVNGQLVNASSNGDATATNSGSVNGQLINSTSNGNATTTNSGSVNGQLINATSNGNATTTNSGSVNGQVVTSAASGNGSTTNSGVISNFGGTAIVVSGTTATLTNIVGGRVIGSIFLGGSTSNTINFQGGNWLFTVSTSGGPTTVNTGGAPFVVGPTTKAGTQIAVLDGTAFGLADRSLMNFTGDIAETLRGRFDGMGAGPGGPTALSFAAPSAGIAADAQAAFSGIPSVAMSYASNPKPVIGKAPPPAAPYYDTTIWASGFGGERHQRADGLLLRADDWAYGGAIGVDRMFGGNLRLGAFVGGGGSRERVEFDVQKIDATYVFGGGYGRFDWVTQYLDFALYGGGIDNKSTRQIANNTVANGLEIATASYGGWFISPELTYGYRIPLSAATMTPRVKVRYVGGELDGYSETGSMQNLSVGRRSINDIEERGEVEFSTVSGGFKGTAYVGVIGLQRLGNPTINTVLLSQSLSFTTPGQASAVGGVIGAGVQYRPLPNVKFFIAGEGIAMSDKSDSFAATGGAQVAF
jgi:hypothetical protein